jgi:hypothetical protein
MGSFYALHAFPRCIQTKEKKRNSEEKGYNTHFGAKKQALFRQKQTFLNFDKKRRKKTQWKAYIPERKMKAHDGA